MKYIKICTLIALAFFIINVIDHNYSNQVHYYTSKEVYYVSSETNEIIVPIFSTTNEVIFLSDRPNYYLCTKDVTYDIKYNYCKYAKEYDLVGNRIILYMVSFSINIYSENMYDAFLTVEYNSVEFVLKIGDIIISDENVYLLNGEAFDYGIKCSGQIDIILNECFYDVIYDEASKNTIIYLKSNRINNYVNINNNQNIYLWQNFNIDLKNLGIYEEEYVKDF